MSTIYASRTAAPKTQPSTGLIGYLKKLPFLDPQPRIAVLRLSGVIAEREGRMKQSGLSLDSIGDSIEKIAKMKKLKAIVLEINSPGGSPAQSELIANRIRALAEEQHVPVLAFVEDVAASGGYWLACAADEIFAVRNSVIGSIGVISSMFGFTDAIKKLGVERRLYTQGDNKSILDPFLPEKKEDVALLHELQKDIHEEFKNYVRTRRAGKLKADEKTLFNGLFWVAPKAQEYGLIDGIGDAYTVIKQRFGDKIKIEKLYKPKGLLKRLMGSFSENIPYAIVRSVADILEERMWWGRVGK